MMGDSTTSIFEFSSSCEDAVTSRSAICKTCLVGRAFLMSEINSCYRRTLYFCSRYIPMRESCGQTC